MGLDMYLKRMPRYGNTTHDEINKLQNYFEWKEKHNDKDSEARKHSFESWTGTPYKDVPAGKVRVFYKQFFRELYYSWDAKKRYPYMGIIEQVGYWRKANHIHKWFVENVQDGIDDCEYHNEVTKETLEELRDVCKKVLNSCELIDGKIVSSYRYDENKNRIPIWEDGKFVKDSTVAEELLPCQSGFFFGSTTYDEWYVRNIEDTLEFIGNVLETTDFETQMIYYCSSW